MSDSKLVRASRDGDQFHYLWAARRCLQLLPLLSPLVAITIEGASLSEITVGDPVDAGEEVIDVAEYFGSEDLASAKLVRYIQLKHSTLKSVDPWTPSGLQKTLGKFAQRYANLQRKLGVDNLPEIEFCFLSNRPIADDFIEAVEDAANGFATRHPKQLVKLEKFTGLNGPALMVFCKRLRLQGAQDNYWEQRSILFQELSHYLPDADMEAPTQLKELVTRKALSESGANPRITRVDVLRALNTSESSLFPAPCKIERINGVVPREQEIEIIGQIAHANNIPVVVHADGGVGKSIFSTRIQAGLPEGSLCILYDCFGNGSYRSASGYRHRPKDALVQIANELAGKGLCHPLLPTSRADSSEYFKAFLYRLTQAIASLKASRADALLCLIIDAADNAQMAAEEIGESVSFVRDLLLEQMPDGVRLVALCRTHRQDRLHPPPATLHLELKPFSRSETAAHLRNAFPNATEHDVDEFHFLSSNNPRVQSMALASQDSLIEVLRRLGPNPKTVESAIGNLLHESIAKICHSGGSAGKSQIDRVCVGLATLRPLIPISVLASISDVDPSVITSFAFDLGRPLIVTGGTIQFFDEPAETWFREHFKARKADLAAFIKILKPLASTAAYVASALPQLMLEAGHFDDLVAMALSSEGLPEGKPLERREVELQRLQFALKASLRTTRYTDAAKLALKAGGESAGNRRRTQLLQANTDLSAIFLDADGIQDIVSQRTFSSGWVGSRHAYEAGLMSGRIELAGEARSRLRMAEEWISNWSRRTTEERNSEPVTNEDIAELAMAHFNIHGAITCARFLRQWRPGSVQFAAARIVARRFVDLSRYGEIDEIAAAAGNNLYLVLAIALELREVHRNPPRGVVKRALSLVLRARVVLGRAHDWGSGDTLLQAVTALVEAGYKLSVYDRDTLLRVLNVYMPPSPRRGLFSRYGGFRFPLLRAYTLRAALANETLELNDLAHTDLRIELERKNNASDSHEAREFKRDGGALLPWHRLWADTFLGVTSNSLATFIEQAQVASSKAATFSYGEESHTLNEISRLWLAILCEANNIDRASMDGFNKWMGSLPRPLYTPTLTWLARLAARTASLEAHALAYAFKAFELTKDQREDAETKVDTYVNLARSVLPTGRSEPEAYFNAAIEVASKIGDENLGRWAAILDLAHRAANKDSPVPEIAYRLARCGEVSYDYSGGSKHFDWEGTVEAVAGLCPVSSLAILSRWRDRNFGRSADLLPVAVSFVVKQGCLDPRTALGLIGFRAHWKQVRLLKDALDSSTDEAERQTAATFLFRYLTMESQSAETWRDLRDLSISHAVQFPGIDELISFAERKDQSTSQIPEGCQRRGGSEKTCESWASVFEGVDLCVSGDISRALRRFMDFEPPRHHERFFKEACERVCAGKEAAFLTAIAGLAELNPYTFWRFLESIPEGWRSRLSLKFALAATLRSFCRRYCVEITNDRYSTLSLELACKLSGVAQRDALDFVLVALGERTEGFDAGRLFTLVGLLVAKLSKSEALEALSFGLDLFEGVVEERDADGPWSEALVPPVDMDEAVAGYIWAGLAAPQRSLRWEAAHVVRGLCKLSREKVVGHLIARSKTSRGGPFADARFLFYQLHARQWLLIALARVAKDNPEFLVPHTDYLIHTALDSESHVLIRGFASKTALSAIDSGVLNVAPDVHHRLANVNRSRFQPVVSNRHERSHRKHGAKDEGDEEAPLYLGHDFGPYWLGPLGDRFGASETEVEAAVKRLIRVEWQYRGQNRWDEDERQRTGIFQNQEASHSHGSYPRTDNVQFYLSYHAMMIVAGELLVSRPLYRNPDGHEDRFSTWLTEHGLTRTDEKWLADRRDAAPLEWPGWKDDRQTTDWLWSIRRTDFERQLLPGGRINLWGHWSTTSESREESTSIGSALVSPDNSEALLRALQTADPRDYDLPLADNDCQIDCDPFALKGWICDNSHHHEGIDSHDPWAGRISYPPVAPAAFVVDLMDLRVDSEERVWSVRSDQVGRASLWSEVWGEYRERNDEAEPENGKRLQGSFEFIVEFLRKINMDLIIKVRIERRLPYSRHRSNESDETGSVAPSARLFLIKSDGSLTAT